MATDAQLRAIGHMTVQWAYLENQITREVAWLLKRSEHRGKRINFRAPFKDLANDWLRLSKRTYKRHTEIVENVQKIVSRAINIQRERNDLTHGNYGSGEYFIKERAGQVIYICENKGQASHIQNLACRISDITRDLFTHQMALIRHFRKALE
jgi:hypothetical protein